MNYTLLNTFFVTSSVIFLYYNVCFLIALIKKRNDIADVVWGLGFIVAIFCPLFLYGIFSMRSIIATTLVTIWGLRISFHIYLRNRGQQEDYRYAQWRESWGNYFYLRTYLQVFLLQGFFLMLIVTPVLFINTFQNSSLTIFDILGVMIWIIGFVCESLADYQLTLFLKEPKNKGLLLMSGLWRYSRHPNYFGEIAQWWGIFIIALSVKWGLLSIIGPLTITFLIIKVSGIPLLEKKMAENRDFKRYKDTTSLLIPWFSLRDQ